MYSTPHTFDKKCLYCAVYFTLLLTPFTISAQQIIMWDFDDGIPSNYPPEINQTDGIATITANTGSLPNFGPGNIGGQALYYTSWNQNNVYYEIVFNGEGYKDFSLSFDHRRTNDGPVLFQISYSIDQGSNFSTLIETISGIQIQDAFSIYSIDLDSYSELNGQKDIRIRIETLSPSSAVLGRFYLDNVIIDANEVVPENLFISLINNGELPIANTPFEMVVEARDANNLVGKVTEETGLSLQKISGNGTGIIVDVSNTIFPDGSKRLMTTVTYNEGETGVAFKVDVNSGFTLESAQSTLIIILSSEPEDPPVSIIGTPISNSDIRLSIEHGTVPGDHFLIVGKKDEPIDFIPDDGISYTANQAFGLGEEVADEVYVVYNGDQEEVVISGLDPYSRYYFEVYTFNGENGTENYLSASASGNFFTCVNPQNPVSNVDVVNPTLNSLELTWQEGDGQFKAVFMNTVNVFSTILDDGIPLPPANNYWNNSGEQLVYLGSENLAPIFNILPNTNYYFKIVELNCENEQTRYSDEFTEFAYKTPTFYEGFSNCALNGWSNIIIRGNSWNCIDGKMAINGIGSSPSTEAWLISPSIDFSNITDASLQFKTKTFGTDNGEAYPQLKVLYSELYPGYGNPALEMYDWQELLYTAPKPNTNNWSGSGFIDLSDKNSNKGYLAFKYISSGNIQGQSTDWELDDIVIENRECSFPTMQSNTVNLDQIKSNSAKISFEVGGGDGRIAIITQGNQVVSLPQNGTSYNFSNDFGTGDVLGGNHFVIAGGDQTSFTITNLTPNTTYSIQFFEYNYCSNENFSYYYNLENDGTNSITFQTLNPSLSEIDLNASFTFPNGNSFSYNEYQTNILDDENSLEIAQFVIQDQNNDNLPTLLNQISFKIEGFENLRKIGLFEGTDKIGEITPASSITFNNLNIVTIDNSQRVLSIRVSFLKEVQDNKQIQLRLFDIIGGNAPTYTPFNPLISGGLSTPIENDENRISVVADRLIFSDAPSVGIVNAPYPLSVYAVDINDNIDRDAIGQISLTTDGIGNINYTNSNSLFNGEIQFENLTYDEAETIEISSISDFAFEANTPGISFLNALTFYEFDNYHQENDGNSSPTWSSDLISASEFIKGNNVLSLAIPAHNVFSCRGFSTTITQPTNNYFLEFSVGPLPGNLMDIFSIQFQLKRSSQGPLQAVLRSDFENPFAGNIGNLVFDISTGFQAFDVPLTGYQGLNGKVTFRIYPYNSGSGNGSLQIDNVIVFGSPSDITEPEFNAGFPIIENYFQDGFEVNVSSSEDGMLYAYWQAVDMPPQSISEVVNNSLYIAEVVKDVEHIFQIAGLNSSQAIDIYLVLEDNDGNTTIEVIQDEVVLNDNSSLSPPQINTQVSSGSISSIIDTPLEAQEVFIFSIDDNGNNAISTDNQGTNVLELSIVPGALNTANWNDAIGGIILRNISTGTPIAIKDTIISEGEIRIIMDDNSLLVPANSSEEYSLSIWLTKSVDDHEIFQLAIPGEPDSHTSLTKDINSSQFENPFTDEVVSEIFEIEVSASQLTFSDYPGNYLPVIGFGLTISATDENGNIDTDEDGSAVQLSLYSGLGQLTSTSGNASDLTKNLINGSVAWDNNLDYLGAVDFFSINAEISGPGLVGNFHSGLISSGNGDLIIKNGEVLFVQNDLIVSGKILIEAGGELILEKGKTLSLYLDFENNGIFSDKGGTLHFMGNVQQNILSGSVLKVNNLKISNMVGVINESELRLKGSLKLESEAKFDADGLNGDRNFVLTSNKSNTANIDKLENGAELTGEVTWQRFIGDVPIAGWNFLTTPIKNQRITDWQDDVKIQGMDNYYPNADKVMYYYDEPIGTNTNQGSEGWRPIELSQTSLSQKAVDLYLFKSAFKNGNLKLTNKGVPFIGDGTTVDGNHIIPLSYTSTSFDGGGWNLVPNPYPSGIDWGKVDRSNITSVNNAFYIWDTENDRYAAYVDDISQNGGDQYIPSGRSFFVKTNASGQSLIFSENSKSGNNISDFRKGNPSIIKLSLRDKNGKEDETIIGLKEGTTIGFDEQFDALKLKSGINIFSKAQSNDLAINTLPDFIGVQSIPIDMEVKENALYTIMGNTVDFHHRHLVYLHEKNSNQYFSIQKNFQKSIRLAPPFQSTNNPQYELLIASPVLLEIGNVSGRLNDTISLPVAVQQLKDVNKMSMTFNWNPTLLKYISVEKTSNPVLTFDVDQSRFEEGKLHVLIDRIDELEELNSYELLKLNFQIIDKSEVMMVQLDTLASSVIRKYGLEMPLFKISDGLVDFHDYKILEGNVVDANGNILDNTKIVIVENQTDTSSLISNGTFEIPIFENSTYEIQAEPLGLNLESWLSLMDLVKLRQHINGEELLSNPYSYIAADLNKSGQLDGEDLSIVKEMILDKDDIHQNWIFIPDGNDLSANPFNYHITSLVNYERTTAVNFTGVLLSDVDLSYSKSLTFEDQLNTNLKAEVLGNNVIQYTLFLGNEIESQALLLNYEFDPRSLEFIEAESLINGGEFNISMYGNGNLKMLWEKGRLPFLKLNSNDGLIRIKFQLRSEGVDAADLIRLKSDELSNLLITNNNQIFRIVESEEITGLNELEDYFQLKTFPNPIHQHLTIQFSLPSNELVRITICNSTGKEVYLFENNYLKGSNEINLSSSMLGGELKKGVYLLRLSTGKSLAISKIVVE